MSEVASIDLARARRSAHSRRSAAQRLGQRSGPAAEAARPRSSFRPAASGSEPKSPATGTGGTRDADPTRRSAKAEAAPARAGLFGSAATPFTLLAFVAVSIFALSLPELPEQPGPNVSMRLEGRPAVAAAPKTVAPEAEAETETAVETPAPVQVSPKISGEEGASLAAAEDASAIPVPLPVDWLPVTEHVPAPTAVTRASPDDRMINLGTAIGTPVAAAEPVDVLPEEALPPVEAAAEAPVAMAPVSIDPAEVISLRKSESSSVYRPAQEPVSAKAAVIAPPAPKRVAGKASKAKAKPLAAVEPTKPAKPKAAARAKPAKKPVAKLEATKKPARER